MKPTNIRRIYSEKNSIAKTTFSNYYLTNPPMTEQSVAPPSYVWDKIEMELNKQDRERSKRLLSLTSGSQEIKPKNRFALYFAAAGATVVAGLVFILR
jgi:hypothetical protein